MPTLIFDPQPVELEAVLERRRANGNDRWDEVWNGVLHMIPPPSRDHQRLAFRLASLLEPLAVAAGMEVTPEVGLGDGPQDYRQPDVVIQRPYEIATQWQPTAALVVEVVSPGDKSREKLDFYAAHGVDEVVIVDPALRTVDWFGLDDGGYQPLEASRVIELGASHLAERIDWPARPAG